MTAKFEEKLHLILKEATIRKKEPMKEHTTFRIGGPADYFAVLCEREELTRVIGLCKEENVPFYIIGKGSNLLVNDHGLPGVVAVLKGGLSEAEREGKLIRAGAGMALSELAFFSAKEGLSGLEFAGGIPGTVGGAVVMNAGAYGGEVKDVLVEAEVYTDGTIRTFTKEELKFGYRQSLIQRLKDAVVISASFHLTEDAPDEIKERIDELNRRREEKQPLELPSAGSTFKRPEGGFASKLIDEAGLRGMRIGGAEVSWKHTGFIVNADDATAEDVKALISYIKEKVYEHSGIMLTPEVKML